MNRPSRPRTARVLLRNVVFTSNGTPRIDVQIRADSSSTTMDSPPSPVEQTVVNNTDATKDRERAPSPRSRTDSTSPPRAWSQPSSPPPPMGPITAMTQPQSPVRPTSPTPSLMQLDLMDACPIPPPCSAIGSPRHMESDSESTMEDDDELAYASCGEDSFREVEPLSERLARLDVFVRRLHARSERAFDDLVKRVPPDRTRPPSMQTERLGRHTEAPNDRTDSRAPSGEA